LNAADVCATIQAKGRSAVLTKFGDVLDANKPWRGNDKDTDVTKVTTYTVIIGPRTRTVGGESVQEGDMVAFLGGDGVNNFDQFDILVDGSTTWKIVGADIVGPGAEILLYKLLLRR
jgi:hypothetical protein